LIQRAVFFLATAREIFQDAFMKKTTLSTNSVHCSLGRCASLFILLLIGFLALCQQVQSATDTPDPGSVGGVLNTADGHSAMPFVTTGVANSAFGAFAQFSNTDANFNTAVGVGALDLNNGDSNTAVGTAALLLNTAGAQNTAVGVDALLSNGVGSGHTAVGFQALQSNIAPPR
jgi:hypothetical protein